MLFLGFIAGKQIFVSREMSQNLKKSRFTNKYPALCGGVVHWDSRLLSQALVVCTITCWPYHDIELGAHS